MRPIRLTLEGLRSYRERQEISFEKAGLFAITGQTGSGKSSILEGLVFALYGAATFDARNAKALISDRAESLTVALTFDVARERYQVIRTLPRGTKGAVHELKGPSGKLLATSKSEVDATIQKLLGMGLDDFLKTVVLPQGAFQQLLHSTPGDRAPLLKNLLGLDRIDQVAAELSTRRGRLQEAVLPLRGRRKDIPADLGERFLTLERDLAEAQKEEEAIRQRVEEGRQREQKRQWLALRERELSERRERLSGLRWPDPAEHARLQALGEQMEARQQAFQAQRTALEEERNALLGRAGDEPQLAPGRLEGWRADLLRLGELGERIVELRQELAQEEACLQELALAQDARREQQTGQEERRLQLLAEGEAAAERARLALAALTALQKELHQRETLEKERLRLTAARSQEEERLGQAQQAAEQALREGEALAGQSQAAEERLRRLEQDSLAAALAHDHQGGDPCPVCQRELPEDWQAPTGEGLDEARAERGRVDEESRQHDRRLAALRTQLEHAGQSLERLGRELERAEGELAALPAPVPLAQREEELRAAEAERDACRQRYAALQEEIRSGQRQLEEASKAVERGQRRRDELAQKLAQQMALTETLEAQLFTATRCPDRARVEAGFPLWEQQRQAWQDEQKVLDDRMEAHRLDEVGHYQEHQRDYLVPWQALLSQLQANAQAAGLDPGAGMGLEQLCQQRIAELGEELKSLADERAALGDGLEEGLEARYQEVMQGRSMLQAQLLMLREKAELAERIDAVLGPGEGALRNLELLHDLLGNRARKGRLSFTQWLLNKRQQELLGLASKIFGDVSGGQYAFSGEFQILDRHSGQERRPNTLSGGETFLASLSLALALSELVGRRGGRLEAFFLDEGFGTLSPECLDRALSALENLAQSGRLIGVITHVVLMAERIENVWIVRKTPLGSRIEVLSEELRQKLLSQDLAAYDPEKHPLLR